MNLWSMHYAPSHRSKGFSFALRLGSAVSFTLVAAFISDGRLHADSVTIDWLTVGDPGNTSDTTGYGAVANSFRIMTFEFTNSQYVGFLNIIDPEGSNPYEVYSLSMADDPRGGITFTTGASAGSKYAAKANMGDKPVNFVSWFDAARVANWLQNGQGSGSTETGAYTLGGATSGTAPAKNPGAQFYIPSENEWYKAAYYKGGSTNAGYWTYATQSDTAPTTVTSGSTGIGTAGNTGNRANYRSDADWNSMNGNVTTVGTNGGPSAYGAFDMSGNVFEWNDQDGNPSSTRGQRGGAYATFSTTTLGKNSSSSIAGVSSKASNAGFRLASLEQLLITGSSTFENSVSAICTVEAGGNPQFNGGFTGSLTVNGGTATLGGAVSGSVSIASGGAAVISAGATLTNAKVSLAPGGTLSVARGTHVPFAAGNIGGLTVSATSGLAATVLSGSVATDSTIITDWSPIGGFNATGSQFVIGDVLSFDGTGTATWVLQAQYDPSSLLIDEATLAAAGDLFLTWRNPTANAWVNAVDGNVGGTPQFFQRAWQPGDTLGSYGVDIAANTVWAVINHNSDFAVIAVPEPGTFAIALGGLACGGFSMWRRKRA